jgi:imidazolonepropionase-like amidohydrolase
VCAPETLDRGEASRPGGSPAPVAGPQVSRIEPGDRLAVVGVRLVEDQAGDAQRDVTILVEGGRIADVLPAGAVLPGAVRRVEAQGLWAVPGLIDCHVHLNGEQTMDAFRRYLTPSAEVKLFHALEFAMSSLSCGFTTLRDVGPGHGVALKTAGRLGLVNVPRILAANCAISATGGHGDWTLFPEDLWRSLGERGTLADGVDECRQAVRRAFREGADLIKVMPSGGGVTNHPDDLAAHQELSLEEVCAVVEEAHRRGARVAAHTNGEEGIRLALEAGVDTVEHGVFEPDPEVLDAMAQRGTTLVPTLLIFDWVVNEGRAAGVFEEGIEAAKRLLDRQFRLVAAAQRAGVNIALGTDNNGVLGLRSSARELDLLCHAGLTSREALAAGTRNAAAACGLGHEVGVLSAGMLADLVLVDGDPLADLTVLSSGRGIRHVLHSAVPATLRSAAQ